MRYTEAFFLDREQSNVECRETRLGAGKSTTTAGDGDGGDLPSRPISGKTTSVSQDIREPEYPPLLLRRVLVSSRLAYGGTDSSLELFERMWTTKTSTCWWETNYDAISATAVCGGTGPPATAASAGRTAAAGERPEGVTNTTNHRTGERRTTHEERRLQRTTATQQRSLPQETTAEGGQTMKLAALRRARRAIGRSTQTDTQRDRKL